MLPAVIAEQLRARGHDVEAINGNPALEGLSDPDVFDLARSSRRAVVTNNIVDFRPLHHAAITPGGPGHHGMVFMAGNYRRTKPESADPRGESPPWITHQRRSAASRGAHPLGAPPIDPGARPRQGFIHDPRWIQAKADTGRVVTALDAKLEQYPGEADLANGETWL